MMNRALVVAIALALFLCITVPVSGANNTTTNATVSTTISNVPIEFPSTAPKETSASKNPLNVTIEGETNVEVNISIKATDFDGPDTISSNNLQYSNSSSGEKVNASTEFEPEKFSDWVKIPNLDTNQVRSVYFWVTVPKYTRAGSYESNVSVEVYEYGSLP